jgi:hypothetical protein
MIGRALYDLRSTLHFWTVAHGGFRAVRSTDQPGEFTGSFSLCDGE